MPDTMPFAGRTFRVVSPAWAHDPLSGEGARRHGGRFNPPGMAAFYSALDPHTAYAEYTASLYDRPGLLCSFDIADAQVIDLTSNTGLVQAGLSIADLTARWSGVASPPSQQAALRLCNEGVDGLIYPSNYHHTGRNLVLWRWGTRPSLTLVDRLGEAVTSPIVSAEGEV